MEFRANQLGVSTQVSSAGHEQPAGQPHVQRVFVQADQYTPVHTQPREQWFSTSSFGNRNYNIQQPDAGRVVLSGARNRYTGIVGYIYGDQLPCMIQSAIICTVIFSILATPLTLLCCIPLIRSLKTTQEKIREGQVQSARDSWHVSTMWCICGGIWIITFSSMFIFLIAMIVVVVT